MRFGTFTRSILTTSAYWVKECTMQAWVDVSESVKFVYCALTKMSVYFSALKRSFTYFVWIFEVGKPTPLGFFIHYIHLRRTFICWVFEFVACCSNFEIFSFSVGVAWKHSLPGSWNSKSFLEFFRSWVVYRISKESGA